EMTTPYRGRGRGQSGRGGRGIGRIYLPETVAPELTFPLLGDWTTINYRSQLAGAQLTAQNKKDKEDKASSSSADILNPEAMLVSMENPDLTWKFYSQLLNQ
ncbi:hypothetical protein A2U01_0040909, partial [Trifolium medium]|nr:hypothetical protein [Trifolium medium]